MTNNTQNQTPEENGVVDNLSKWLAANKKIVIAVAVTAIVIGGIFAIVDNLRDKAYQNQWSNLFMAEMAVANGGDASSYAPLEEFAAKYKTKPAGVFSRLLRLIKRAVITAHKIINAIIGTTTSGTIRTFNGPNKYTAS